VLCVGTPFASSSSDRCLIYGERFLPNWPGSFLKGSGFLSGVREGEHAGPALNRPAETIYREKISGARADRPQLAKLMASLRDGDVVLVTKLDLIESIGKAGAAFRSLGDPLWDTSSSQGRLLSTLLAAIAEFERDLIRERTGEGRKRAQAACAPSPPRASDERRPQLAPALRPFHVLG
jgi:hypothetical protein